MHEITLYKVEDGTNCACVLCGDEIDTGELWPDNRALLPRGRHEHVVCELCCVRLFTDVHKHDPAHDIDCSRMEGGEVKEGEREGEDGGVPDGGAFRT